MSLEPFDADAFAAALAAAAAATAAAAEAARVQAINDTIAANLAWFQELDGRLMTAAQNFEKKVCIGTMSDEIHRAIHERYKSIGAFVNIHRELDGTLKQFIIIPDPVISEPNP